MKRRAPGISPLRARSRKRGGPETNLAAHRVRATGAFKQYVGELPHRGYTWFEQYDSLAAVETGEHTPACDEVWARVHKLVQDGAHARSIWLPAPTGAGGACAAALDTGVFDASQRQGARPAIAAVAGTAQPAGRVLLTRFAPNRERFVANRCGPGRAMEPPLERLQPGR